MGCLASTFAGGGLEIGGLALVVYEIMRVQRREFPQRRGWVRRSLAWLRRLARRPQSQAVHGGGATAHAQAGGSVVLTVERGPAPTLEGRVARMEQQIEDLQRKQREDNEGLDRRIVEANRRLDDAALGLRKDMDKREAERREALADSLLLQKIGTGAFVLGVVLSVLGDSVTC